jgi:hypothetical protein
MGEKMKFKDSIKSFWRDNKKGYLWSCLALTLGGLLIGLIGERDMTATSLFILASFPLMLLMAFGIYNLGGKE